MRCKILFSEKNPVSIEFMNPRRSHDGSLNVLSTARTASILKRSARQVYRYVKKGLLHPFGPFLNDLLFNDEEVLFLKRLIDARNGRLGVPSSWQKLFPEYRVRDLDWRSDKALIISRVLNHGSRQDFMLLIKVYSTQDLKTLLIKRGSRVLNARSNGFWCWFFRIPKQIVSSKTLMGQTLGGAR